jgi:hypothetical protein
MASQSSKAFIHLFHLIATWNPHGPLSLVPFDMELTWMLTWNFPSRPSSPHLILEPSSSSEFIHSKMLQPIFDHFFLMTINLFSIQSPPSNMINPFRLDQPFSNHPVLINIFPIQSTLLALKVTL